MRDRIKRAAEDFNANYKGPKQRAKAIAEADSFNWIEKRSLIYIFPDDEDRHSCPACGANALLLGSVADEQAVEKGQDDDCMFEVVNKWYSVEEFFCPACHLHLFGTDEIAAAELPDGFDRQEEHQREFDEGYNND